MSSEWPLWEVFIRGQHGLNHRHVGSLHAVDANQALRNARDVYTRRHEGVSIWVARSNDIVASSPSDNGPLFKPADFEGLPPPELPRRIGPGMSEDRFEYALRLGDNALILSHRLSQWCGHGPALEEDIALTNVALDLLGQAQLWLELAGALEDKGRSADDLAYRRDAGAFRNALLVERPNGDYGHTLMRQYLFDAWHIETLSALARSADAGFAEIAAKAEKEAAYHVERSAELVIALGDGTPESHTRMQTALDALWPYAAELFVGDALDARLAAEGVAPAAESLKAAWDAATGAVFAQATLTPPASAFAHKGGRAGRHTEALGPLLAQMQFLPRAYPDARW